MPGFRELRDALRGVVQQKLDRGLTPKDLEYVVEDILRNPLYWGLPTRWKGAPNFFFLTIWEMICEELWGMPTHPDRLPRGWRHLPRELVKPIAKGGERWLWPTVPSKLRCEWLTSVSTNRRWGGTEWRRWMQPLCWVTRHCSFLGEFIPRDDGTAFWFAAKKDWVGWERPFMGGKTPKEMVDEVMAHDLTQGSKTSPVRVFERVVDRNQRTWLEQRRRENAALPAMPWTLTEGVEQLLTGAALVEEGARMDHCVGSYVNLCQRGEAYILKLANSTAEIVAWSGEVFQHRGMSNAEPPEEDKKTLQFWLNNRKEVKK
jgi:hypothetical protein